MLRPLIFGLAVSNLLDVASALAIETTTTRNGEATKVRRAPTVATISLGDMDQYINSDEEGTAEGNSVAIFPTAIAAEPSNGGYSVVFGPDLQHDIDKVIKEKCKDANDMNDCVHEVQKLLHDSNLPTLSKRVLPLLAAGTISAIIQWVGAAIAVGSAVAAAYSAAKSIKITTDDDNGVFAQVNAAKNADVVEIATGTDNKVMASFTVVPPASTTTTSHLVHVEELTEDDGDNKKGDILISIPEEMGEKMSDFLGMMGLSDIRRESGVDTNIEQRSIVTKRVPPAIANTPARCRRIIQQLAAMMLVNQQEGGLEMIVADNANNPMNAAANAAGAAVPDMDVDGGNVAVGLAREIVRNNLGDPGDDPPDLDDLPDYLYRAAINIAFIYLKIVNQIAKEQAKLLLAITAKQLVRYTEKAIRCTLTQGSCLEDDCQGYGILAREEQIGGLGAPLDVWQTGQCRVSLKKGCDCRIVAQSTAHRIYPEYFQELQDFMNAVLDDSEDPTCDLGNKLKLADTEFDDVIKKGCQEHDELKKLKKRGEDGFQWSGIDDYGLQWGLDWNDKGDKCQSLQCSDVFDIFKSDNTCVWGNGGEMSKFGYVETDCGIASYSVDRPEAPECWSVTGGQAFGAPRGQKEVDEEGGVGTSVDDAINEFCNDIDGQKVVDSNDEAQNSHYMRWGYSEFRVSERRSFWLKAEYAPGPACQGYEFPHKTNCRAALSQGLETCGGTRTFGLKIHGIGCIAYSIHVTSNVHDDSPPWRDPVVRFPPPGNAKYKSGQTPVLNCNNPWYRMITDQDIDKAIDLLCGDGKEITGFGAYGIKGLTNYPPDGQPPFYPDDDLTLHITQGAEIPEGQDPYQDRWCEGYDWKLGKDDCTFALRKMWHICGSSDGRRGSDFLYRCINYRTTLVNLWP